MTDQDTITTAAATLDNPRSILAEILARWGHEDANDVLADMEQRIAAAAQGNDGFLTVRDPRFHWVGMQGGLALQCGRVTVGGVKHSPPYEGVEGPWWGWVGQGYPNPFEGYFNSEAEAKDAVEKAARRLLGLEDVSGIPGAADAASAA